MPSHDPSSTRAKNSKSRAPVNPKLNPSIVVEFITIEQALEPVVPNLRPRALSTRHRIAQASSASTHAYQSLDGPVGGHHSRSNSRDTLHPHRLHPTMSRPSSSHRPTQIPMPPNDLGSPAGSPRPPSSPTSPRSSFLPSFMRTRSRTVTQSNRPTTSGDTPAASREPSSGPHASSVTRSVSTPVSGGLSTAAAVPLPTEPAESKTHRIRLVPHLETSRSLAFDPVVREVLPIIVPPGISPSAAAASITSVGPAINGKAPALLLKIGRFTDKSQLPVPNTATAAPGAGSTGTMVQNAAASRSAGGTASMPVTASLTIAGGGGDICSPKVAFKSKVVSRSHAEIWCEPGGKFFIRDTSSSSGTFLNHIRLSSPNTESRPTALNDGDVLQLGVDYQGGMEDMFRCVKMRVELGREWQRAANEFNTNALKQLKALGGDPKGKAVESPVSTSKSRKASVTDCCICLFSVTVCQSLFIAPCSHVFHYKCIRPLLQQHYPGFSCPLCRTFANLEEDVETEDAWEIASRRASVISRRPSNHSIRLPPTSDGPAYPVSDAIEGQPSTGIGFGERSASVEELLAADSQESESEVEINGMPTLGRQSTAVASPTLAALRPNETGESSDVEMRAGTPLADPIPTNLISDPTLNPLFENTAESFDATGVAIPSRAEVDAATSPESQTPRNDTFLATLAPGMHQRLDLANQMDRIGRDESLPEIVEGEGEDAEAAPPVGPKHAGRAGQANGAGSGSGSRSDELDGERGDDGWVQFDTDDQPERGGRREDVEMAA